MDSIKVFIASSFELLTTRWYVGNIIRELDEEFRPSGFPIRMLCWEDYEPAYVNNIGKQEEYNADLVIPCDIFFGLFWQKCGKYTQTEVRVAKESLATENIHLCLDTTGNKTEDLTEFLHLNPVSLKYDNPEKLGDYIKSVIKAFIYKHSSRKTYCRECDIIRYYGIGSSFEMKNLIGNEIRYISDIGERTCGKRFRLYPFNTQDNIKSSKIALCLVEANVDSKSRDEIRLSKMLVDQKCSELSKLHILTRKNLEKDFNDELQTWNHFYPSFNENAEGATILRLYLITSLLAESNESIWRLNTNALYDSSDVVGPFRVIGRKAYFGDNYLLNLMHLPAYTNSAHYKELYDTSASNVQWQSFGLNVLNSYCELLRMEQKMSSKKIKEATERFWSGNIQEALDIINSVKSTLTSLDNLTNEMDAIEKQKSAIQNEFFLRVETYKASALMNLTQGNFNEFLKDSHEVLACMRHIVKFNPDYIMEFVQYEYHLAIDLQENSHYNKAISLLNEVLLNLDFINDQSLIFAVKLGMANTYAQGGNFEKAEEIYLQLNQNEPIVLQNLIPLYLSFHMQEKARPLAERLIELMKVDMGIEPFERVMIMMDATYELGDCYSMSHDYSNAIKNYNKAINIANQLRPQTEKEKNQYYEHLFLMFNGIGNFYSDEYGNYDMAIKFYEQSESARLHLKRISEVQRVEEETMLQNNLALAYYRKGNMKLAIDYNQKAEAGRRFLYNMEGSPASLIELARTLTNFAEVLKSSDNFAQALLKVEEAELLLKQAMHGQPEEIAFKEMIPTVFLKANIWLLQNGHRKNYGIKSMASLRDWAKTHPDFYYSPVIIDECIKYQIP